MRTLDDAIHTAFREVEEKHEIDIDPREMLITAQVWNDLFRKLYDTLSTWAKEQRAEDLELLAKKLNAPALKEMLDRD